MWSLSYPPYWLLSHLSPHALRAPKNRCPSRESSHLKAKLQSLLAESWRPHQGVSTQNGGLIDEIRWWYSMILKFHDIPWYCYSMMIFHDIEIPWYSTILILHDDIPWYFMRFQNLSKIIGTSLILQYSDNKEKDKGRHVSKLGIDNQSHDIPVYRHPYYLQKLNFEKGYKTRPFWGCQCFLLL